jgi:KDO2-lipid IV(A) lauroyltransferase
MLFKLLSRLPTNSLYVVSYLLYLLAYHVLGLRKTVVLSNLKHAFPTKTDNELRAIARRAYRNLADVAVETLKGIAISREELRRRVQFNNPELVSACHQNGQPVILMATHQCNWEWLLLAANAELPFEIDPIYKPLHNPKADQILRQARARFGGQPIPVKETLPTIVKRGRSVRGLALLADQSPLRGEETYWTEFLNQQTGFYVGAEKLARLTNSAVFFADMRRLKRGYYEITLKPLGRPPYPREGYGIIERYVREAEHQILQSPSDWFWAHRRWKHKKPLYA